VSTDSEEAPFFSVNEPAWLHTKRAATALGGRDREHDRDRTPETKIELREIFILRSFTRGYYSPA
jgi:hypothetical protein